MRLIPGQLNTSLHATAVPDTSLVVANRCSRDRRVFQRDNAYRQVDPVKEPTPTPTVDQGCTGFAFGSYQGFERFLLANGDALFATTTDVSSNFLERTSLGSSSLMDDLLVHSATDEHTGNSFMFQHRDNFYVANRDFVRWVSVENPDDNGKLTKNYDPSLYESYFTTSDNWSIKSLSGVTPTVIPYKENGVTGTGSAPTVAVQSDKVRLLDAYNPASGNNVIYDLLLTWAADQTWSNFDWFVIPITMDTDGTGASGYSHGSTDETDEPVFNDRWDFGLNPQVTFKTAGGATLSATDCGFINYAGVTYIFGQLKDGTNPPTGDTLTFRKILIRFAMRTGSSKQKATVGSIYACGNFAPQFTGYPYPQINSPMDATDRSGMMGYGPVFDDTADFIEYAFRGSDAGETTFGDPVKVMVKMSDYYAQDRVGTSGPVLPRLVTIAPGYVLSGGYAKVQVLRKSIVDGLWYRIGLIDNNGTASLDDVNREDEIEAFATASLTVSAPSVVDVVSGCEWKGHLVFADYLGRVFFSDQLDPSIFIWRDYTEGGTLENVTTQPRWLDVSGQNEPIIACFGLDSIYFLTRRRIYFMSGANAIDAAGPYQIQQSKGVVGPFAATPSGDGLLVACDDGLYWARVAQNSLGRAGDTQFQNITLGEIRDSYAWLIGDDDERQRVTIAEANGNLWLFRDERWLHRSQLGLWTTGEWASSKHVLQAVTDGLGRIAIAFTDNSVGFIGDFPTDGGVTVDGDDGRPFRWSVRSKKFANGSMPTAVDVQPFNESSDEVDVELLVYGDRAPNGRALAFSRHGYRVGVDRSAGGAGNRWWQFELSGASTDVVSSVDIELAPTTRDAGVR